MNITIKQVDDVIERTGCSYATAKEALEQTDGDVLEAILLIEKKQHGSSDFGQDPGADKDKLVEKIKAAIKKGNVNRIYLTRNGETLINVPVTVGVVGGLIGLVAAPWAVIVGGLVAYGADCKVVIEHNDGSSEELN